MLRFPHLQCGPRGPLTVAASALLWPGSGGLPALPVAQARPGRPHGDEQLFSKRENLNRGCLPCFSVCSDRWDRLDSGRCAARTIRYDQMSRARPGLIRPVSPLPPEIGAVSPFFNPAMDLCRAGPPFCGRRQLVVPPRWSSPRWSLPRSSPLVASSPSAAPRRWRHYQSVAVDFSRSQLQLHRSKEFCRQPDQL